MDTHKRITRRARSFSVAVFSSRDLWWAQRRPSGKYVIHCVESSFYDRRPMREAPRRNAAS
jgi:hypothetical protein